MFRRYLLLVLLLVSSGAPLQPAIGGEEEKLRHRIRELEEKITRLQDDLLRKTRILEEEEKRSREMLDRLREERQELKRILYREIEVAKAEASRLHRELSTVRKFQDAVTPLLLDALRSPDKKQRMAAYEVADEALAAGVEGIRPVLHASLEQNSFSERCLVARLLLEHGTEYGRKKAMEAARQWFTDAERSTTERLTALKVLLPEVGPFRLRQLVEPAMALGPEARIPLARALREANLADAVPLLLESDTPAAQEELHTLLGGPPPEGTDYATIWKEVPETSFTLFQANVQLLSWERKHRDQPVSLNLKEVSLSETLEFLQAISNASGWVLLPSARNVPAINRVEKDIPFTQALFEILEQVGLTSRIHCGVRFIGSQEELDGTLGTLHDRLAFPLPEDEFPELRDVRRRLWSQVTRGHFESGTELDEALEFFAARSGIRIQTLPSLRDKKLPLDGYRLQRTPIVTHLRILALQADLYARIRWGTVFFGTKQEIEALDRFTEPSLPKRIQERLNQPISVSANTISLRAALKFIGQATQVAFEVDDAIEERSVSGGFRNVPAILIVRNLLHPNGLTFEEAYGRLLVKPIK